MSRPESLAARLTQAWTGCVAQRLERQMGQDILPQDFVQVDLVVCKRTHDTHPPFRPRNRHIEAAVTIGAIDRTKMLVEHTFRRGAIDG